MSERRIRRSPRKDEALRLLLEAVKARSEVTSIAVVDARGHVVTGMGTERELAILGAIAEPVAGGVLSGLAERLTEGTDVMSREIKGPRGRVYLAALGDRVGRMVEAASGVERILARTG
ncbi:MAG: hypothetical protein KF819_34795 [Labilithrix sp.]|nr:hypothetical protein [Labilithrix sp.]